MSGTHRTFAAIPLPEAVTDLLEDAQDDLRVGHPVEADNMHLTLVFLGDLRGPELDEVNAAFEAIRVPAPRVALTGLGAFGGTAPRSIHAVVEPTRALRHLQAKVEQAARGVGIGLPSRRFVPHVTIARLSGRREEAHEVQTFVARRAMLAPEPFTADAFCLYLSTLTRDGPVYDEIARYGLGTPAGDGD